jgi:hypothetical protein
MIESGHERTEKNSSHNAGIFLMLFIVPIIKKSSKKQKRRESDDLQSSIPESYRKSKNKYICHGHG